MSYRTHTCEELNMKNIGEEVILAGFVKRIRNLGEITFIDLRDHYGVTQLVLDSKFKEFVHKLTPESTMQAKGIVRERSSKNSDMKTGDIEIEVREVKVLGKAKANLPFEINENYKNNKEDLRLEYRYLDLRNEEIHNNIVLRSKILKDTREIMDELGFIEIQTPIFANSSPEGARDYLVPSRLHPGEFYALPQAPQQFKQILMVSGFDKYYQIAPCFRDEDPRADRSPCEFYQLDFEMAFAEQEDVLEVLEKVIYEIFIRNTEKEVDKPPFTRFTYSEAMEKYGIDKPDLRNPLINYDVTECFNDSGIKIFEGNHTVAIKLPATAGRKVYDRLTDFVKSEYVGGDGLAWAKKEDGEISGGIAKLLNEDIIKKLENIIGKIKDGESIFLISNPEKEKAQKIAGLFRIKLGEDFKLIDESKFKMCFITDFPMYELDDEGNLDFAHNPFSMPKGGMEALEEKEPLDIYAYQYDVVCNGYEIASGAVRNHDIDIMAKVFEIAGYERDEIEKRFKALYTAFQYGAPPHAGAAPGMDRIIMLLAETNNIREIIAFPKNSRARDVMMNAPSKVSEEQLKELHLIINKPEKNKEKDEKKNIRGK